MLEFKIWVGPQKKVQPFDQGRIREFVMGDAKPGAGAQTLTGANPPRNHSLNFSSEGLAVNILNLVSAPGFDPPPLPPM